MTKAKMIKTIYLKASPETVWAYLTEADKLARWFHEADTDLNAPNVEYALLRENPNEQGNKMCWGKVLKAEKPNRLVYTFTHTHLQGVETTVEWVLIATEGGTQLTMTHTGLDANKETAFGMLTGHDKGWDEHFQRLRMVASTF